MTAGDEQDDFAFRTLVERVPDIIARFDAALRCVYINPAITALTGRPPEDYLGKTHREAGLSADVCDVWESRLRTVLRTGGEERFVFESRPRGRLAVHDVGLTPELGPDGVPRGVLSIAHDVTRQRQREQALRESEERFRDTFERAPIGIAHVGLDGRWLRLNDRLCEIMGYSRQELEQRTFQGITWPEDLAPDLANAARLLTGEIQSYSMEKRYVRRDGALIWANLTSSLVRADNGAPRYFIAIVEDLTARKEADQREEILRDASAMVSQTLDPDEVLLQLCRLLVRTAADWCMVDTRTPAGELRRFPVLHRDPAKQLLADRVATFTPPEGAVTGEVLRTGVPVLLDRVWPELIAERAGSDAYAAALLALEPASVLVVPILIGGNVRGAFSCGRSDPRRPFTLADLSLMEGVAKRAALAVENARLFKEAQEANRLKDDFIATLSHELRTPLNAMLGWISMLQSGVLEPEHRGRALATIERNARAQAQLVGDILDVSRIIAGKIALARTDTAFAPLVERVVETMRLGAVEKNLALHVAIDGEGATVHGDPSRLQQVVWNLLSNAIKFTPAGGRIDVAQTVSEGAVVLTVKDTGIGISGAFLPHVFDRFRQADPSTTRSHSGLGLGLAIARHLVELHGGTIDVASDGKDHGATFTVRLPLVTAAARDLRVSNLPGGAGTLAGVDLLVVDDHADTRELMAAILTAQGGSVRVAASSRDAVRLFSEAHADVALIDISMPDEDGFTCLERLRHAAVERGAIVTALAVTAHALEQHRARSLAAGFAAHVSKPVSPDQLVEAIRSALRRD